MNVPRNHLNNFKTKSSIIPSLTLYLQFSILIQNLFFRNSKLLCDMKAMAKLDGNMSSNRRIVSQYPRNMTYIQHNCNRICFDVSICISLYLHQTNLNQFMLNFQLIHMCMLGIKVWGWMFVGWKENVCRDGTAMKL